MKTGDPEESPSPSSGPPGFPPPIPPSGPPNRLPPSNPPPPVPPPRTCIPVSPVEVSDTPVISVKFYRYKKPTYDTIPPTSGILVMYEEGYVETIYTLGRRLGRGFAKVYHAIHIQTEKEYAIKVINKVLSMECDPHAIKMEIQIMKNNNHLNLVKYVEAYETPFRVYIVMEYLGEQLANIDDRSQHQNGMLVPFYKEEILKYAIRQVLEALNDLHNRGIIHRDVKPENMLWVTAPTVADTNNNSNLRMLKLIDFGMAISPPKDKPLLQWVGTTEFQAPEMVMQSEKGYDYKADMWSLGIVIYFLVVGKLPFEDKNPMMVKIKIKKGQYSLDQPQWNCFSESLKDFVKGLLCIDPEQRLSTQQALCHSWIKC